MAGVGLQLRGRVSNPAETALLPEARELMLSFTPSADRNFLIQPEGMAAVKAFLESPRGPEEKTYAIVDVGAGTTEVSFFFNGGMKPSYLADSTEAVGGGKFDIELAEVWRCDVETARRLKEQGGGQIPEVPSVGAIRRQYDMTCRKILRERRLTARANKRFDLFVIGGGGRLPVLRDSLTRCQLPGDFIREHTRQLTPPASLRNRADVESDITISSQMPADSRAHLTGSIIRREKFFRCLHGQADRNVIATNSIRSRSSDCWHNSYGDLALSPC